MQDITVFLWIGAIVAVLLQYRLRVAPVYFIGELLGIGGLYQTIAEYDAGNIDGSITVIMAIVCVMVVIYSIWNHTQIYARGKK